MKKSMKTLAASAALLAGLGGLAITPSSIAGTYVWHTHHVQIVNGRRYVTNHTYVRRVPGRTGNYHWHRWYRHYN